MPNILDTIFQILGVKHQPQEFISPLQNSPPPDPFIQKGYTKSGEGYYMAPQRPNQGYAFIDKEKIPAEVLAKLLSSNIQQPSMAQTALQMFGAGQEEAQMKPQLFDAIIQI